MTKDKSAYKFVDEEMKKRYINEIIAYFQDERDEEIGLLAAEKILDFFMQSMGDELYKKAISDCKKLITDGLEDLEFQLDVLSPGD